MGIAERLTSYVRGRLLNSQPDPARAESGLPDPAPTAPPAVPPPHVDPDEDLKRAESREAALRTAAGDGFDDPATLRTLRNTHHDADVRWAAQVRLATIHRESKDAAERERQACFEAGREEHLQRKAAQEKERAVAAKQRAHEEADRRAASQRDAAREAELRIAAGSLLDDPDKLRSIRDTHRDSDVRWAAQLRLWRVVKERDQQRQAEEQRRIETQRREQRLLDARRDPKDLFLVVLRNASIQPRLPELKAEGPWNRWGSGSAEDAWRWLTEKCALYAHASVGEVMGLKLLHTANQRSTSSPWALVETLWEKSDPVDDAIEARYDISPYNARGETVYIARLGEDHFEWFVHEWVHTFFRDGP